MEEVKDAHGNVLSTGDTVIITRSLNVKGSKDIKQGAVVKNIRVGDDTEAIEGKIDGTMMVIKTMYVKKK